MSATVSRPSVTLCRFLSPMSAMMGPRSGSRLLARSSSQVSWTSSFWANPQDLLDAVGFRSPSTRAMRMARTSASLCPPGRRVAQRRSQVVGRRGRQRTRGRGDRRPVRARPGRRWRRPCCSTGEPFHRRWRQFGRHRVERRSGCLSVESSTALYSSTAELGRCTALVRRR